MKPAIPLVALLLVGCASSPEYVAQKSNFDVCRLTMRGPHARNAELEAQKRGLNCTAYYPAIQQQMANENAAIQNMQRALQPPPRPAATNCTSYRVGNTIQTNCN
jgi:hypothetical protein